jgi:hypothetical protein
MKLNAAARLEKPVFTDDHALLPEDGYHHSRDIFILGGQNACTGLEQLDV